MARSFPPRPIWPVVRDVRLSQRQHYWSASAPSANGHARKRVERAEDRLLVRAGWREDEERARYRPVHSGNTTGFLPLSTPSLAFLPYLVCPEWRTAVT